MEASILEAEIIPNPIDGTCLGCSPVGMSCTPVCTQSSSLATYFCDGLFGECGSVIKSSVPSKASM